MAGLSLTLWHLVQTQRPIYSTIKTPQSQPGTISHSWAAAAFTIAPITKKSRFIRILLFTIQTTNVDRLQLDRFLLHVDAWTLFAVSGLLRVEITEICKYFMYFSSNFKSLLFFSYQQGRTSLPEASSVPPGITRCPLPPIEATKNGLPCSHGGKTGMDNGRAGWTSDQRLRSKPKPEIQTQTFCEWDNDAYGKGNFKWTIVGFVLTEQRDADRGHFNTIKHPVGWCEESQC